MPPKKKGGGKGKKAKKELVQQQSTEWDDLDVDAVRKVVDELRRKEESLRKQRNLVQVERDTVKSYYDITLQDIKDTESQICAVDQEIERVENDNRVEKRVYAHKVRHLEYEHNRKLKCVREQKDHDRRELEEENQVRTDNLVSERTRLNDELHDLELMYSAEIEKMKREHERSLREEEERLLSELSVLKKSCNDRLSDVKKDLELKETFHILDTEERKNLHISNLMTTGRAAVDRINQHYNEVSKNNLAQIDKLNQDICTSEQRSAKNKENEIATKNENLQLSEPLAVANAEVARLSDEVRHQEKDQQSLRNTKARISVAKSNFKKLSTEYDDLQNKYDAVVREQDELHQKFDEVVSNVCLKNRCKSIILQHQNKNLSKEIETTAAQVQEVSKATAIDPEETKQISSTLKIILREKNDRIDQLKSMIASATKKYNCDLEAFQKENVEVNANERFK